MPVLFVRLPLKKVLPLITSASVAVALRLTAFTWTFDRSLPLVGMTSCAAVVGVAVLVSVWMYFVTAVPFLLPLTYPAVTVAEGVTVIG